MAAPGGGDDKTGIGCPISPLPLELILWRSMPRKPPTDTREIRSRLEMLRCRFASCRRCTKGGRPDTRVLLSKAEHGQVSIVRPMRAAWNFKLLRRILIIKAYCYSHCRDVYILELMYNVQRVEEISQAEQVFLRSELSDKRRRRKEKCNPASITHFLFCLC